MEKWWQNLLDLGAKTYSYLIDEGSEDKANGTKTCRKKETLKL